MNKENPINGNFKKLNPLGQFCINLGMIPTSYTEAMTYEEQILWLCNFYNTEILPVVNNNTELTEEAITKFNELYTYVHDYFDNLDVQDEINQKLDNMVADGTLETLIMKYIQKIDNVKFITNGFWDNTFSQDIHVIQHAGKNILVDTGSDLNFPDIQDFIDSLNILHFDYVIITHYHGDHSGNFKQLVNLNYINHNSVVYMPVEVSGFNIESTIAEYKAFCAQNNIVYQVPTNDTIITINDLIIKFYNCNATVSETTYTEYNECSIVLEFIHRNIKALYTGDCDKQAFDYFYKNNILCYKTNIFKMGHHGINQYTSKDFINQIKPDYAIQNVGINDFAKNNISISEQGSMLKSFGTLIYPTCMNENNIVLVSDGSSIKIENGKNYELSNQETFITLYVNSTANTNHIQNGTQEYPFHELMQAIGYIKQYPTHNYQINLAEGTYGLSHESEKNKNNNFFNCNLNTQIKVIGTGTKANTILNGVWVRNSYLWLENVTINVNANNGLYIQNGNVILNNVDFTGTTGTTQSAIICRFSKLELTNVNIGLANEGLIASDSYIYINSLLFNNTLSSYINNSNSNIICSSATTSIKFNPTIENVKDFNNIHIIPAPPFILFNKTFNDNITSVNLSEYNTNISKWGFIEIEFTTSDNVRYNSGKLMYPSNLKIEPLIAHNNGNNLYLKTCACVLQNNVINLNYQLQIALDNTKPYLSTGDYIHITNIKLYPTEWRYIN